MEGEVKRILTEEEEIALLKEIVDLNPYEDTSKWGTVHKRFCKFAGRNIKFKLILDHLRLLFKLWEKKLNKRGSEGSDEYDEKQMLLEQAYYLYLENERKVGLEKQSKNPSQSKPKKSKNYKKSKSRQSQEKKANPEEDEWEDEDDEEHEQSCPLHDPQKQAEISIIAQLLTSCQNDKLLKARQLGLDERKLDIEQERMQLDKEKFELEKKERETVLNVLLQQQKLIDEQCQRLTALGTKLKTEKHPL